ncbi:hypothetical protein BRADI_3g13746v3 [Brachypodium distachyon]|uniref:Uncharacterized protein n=1 Tax=Brachypodium distachyon TaxID=15368 RepID=A0A2K2CWX7_BRADI|nr:hypothetical protein BRADI_3g13746v3 [Brachypodium distachyon]
MYSRSDPLRIRSSFSFSWLLLYGEQGQHRRRRLLWLRSRALTGRVRVAAGVSPDMWTPRSVSGQNQ